MDLTLKKICFSHNSTTQKSAISIDKALSNICAHIQTFGTVKKKGSTTVHTLKKFETRQWFDTKRSFRALYFNNTKIGEQNSTGSNCTVKFIDEKTIQQLSKSTKLIEGN